MSMFRDLCAIWRTLIILLTPILASPILCIDGSREMACLYAIVIVGVYWTTEALPIPINGLCPFLLFSALGVLPVKAVAANYVKEPLMFGISCLSFALCVERWNLHKRVALNCLLLFGSTPKWLMLGFMVPTWLISMLISNTSTTAMMIPVAAAVLENLKDVNTKKLEQRHLEGTSTGRSKSSSPLLKSTAVEMHQSNDHTRAEVLEEKEYKSFCKALNLCICYSATIGGTASLIGTSPNLIMQGQADEVFSQYGMESGVNFLSWMMCCLPISAICLALAWVWLVVHFLGVRHLVTVTSKSSQNNQTSKDVIREFIKKLGPFSFPEKATIAFFCVLLSLWLTIKLPGGRGWSVLFKPGFVTNSTVGLPILALLTIFPSSIGKKGHKSGRPAPPLLDWWTIQNKYPWNYFLLMSGGYCIASTCQQSGLSYWIATQMTSLTKIEPWLCVLILSVVISFMTEITSNSATASILCPILAQMAIAVKVNPLLFLFPGTLACSLAFMFPVATPPNAIVFASGQIKIIDMVKAGFVLNLMCVCVVNFGFNMWGDAIFGLNSLPAAMALTSDLNVTSSLLPFNVSQIN